MERDFENSHKNPVKVAWYTITHIVWVFMVGSEMLRMRFSNELHFLGGFRFTNRVGLKMATNLPPPPLSLGMCVNGFIKI